MGRNEKGAYLEYYAISANRKHLHGRIYENGEEEKMDVIKEYIIILIMYKNYQKW
jgi:hypothetical protein